MGVVERHRLDVHQRLTVGAAFLVDGAHRPVDDGERLQAEEVELDESRFLHVVQVELRQHAAACLVGVERHEVRQRGGRDDHAARMLARVAHHAFEFVRHVHDFAGVFVALHEVAQFLLALHRLGQRHAHLERNHLGQPIRQAERLALHPRHVAHDRARRHRAEGDDLAHRVVAVALLHMVDDALAALHAEVDVEVRHGHALRVEQTLEQEVVLQGVQIRDAQRESHQGGVAGAPAPHRHVVFTPPVDELLHDEEVAGKAHFADDAQFVVEALAVALGVVAGAAGAVEVPGQPLGGAAGQQRVEGGALRHGIFRQVVGAERQFVAAAFGEFQRVVERLRQIGEQRPHLFGVAQVLLVAVASLPARVVEHPALLDANPRLVGLEVVLLQEAHVVACHHRRAGVGGQFRRIHREPILFRTPGAHDFEIDPGGEGGAPIGQPVRRGRILLSHRLADVAVASEQDDQPFRRPEDRLAGGPAVPGALRVAVVSAAGVGARHQPQQVAVALRASGQQHAAVGAAGVFVFPVHADDRLDAVLATGGVELHQAEQVAAVGERHRRHAQRGGALGEVAHLDQAIVDGELAVDRQMHEVAQRHRRCAAACGGDLVASLIGDDGSVVVVHSAQDST